jgi:hypothetical protein
MLTELGLPRSWPDHYAGKLGPLFANESSLQYFGIGR